MANNDLGLMVLPEQVKQQLQLRKMDESQWNTMANVLFPGAAPASVLLVWDYCKARNLDPFKKPCHIVPMRVRVGSGDDTKYVTRDTVLPGIYEYRTTAQRTGDYMGQARPEYGPTISLFGVDAPEWCEITAYRWNDRAKEKVPFTVRTYFKEACATKWKAKNDKTPVANDRWERAPVQMLTKCCEAAVLRMAFPEEIGGVPTEEEITDTMPDVVEGAVVNQAAAPSMPAALEAVSEALRERIGKAFVALKITPAQQLVRINEFIKPGHADEGAEQLLEWCKDEFARQQGTTRVRTDAGQNDKVQAGAAEPAGDVVDAEVTEGDDEDEDEPEHQAPVSAPVVEAAKVETPASETKTQAPAAKKKNLVDTF